ncbi:ATP-dependent DNA ligase [Paenibacillus alkalitolerans]|uniref:ATP-dependent DNA ligase n=1 Tax=Paenibacillus alkalitolerans TaxID=2799335 RepID=UPI001F3A9C96|nr:RNA ligase family protein [Paenibacillus alkalitolerans]
MNPIVPMEPASSDTIPDTDEWLAQIKWDGVRICTYYDGHAVRLFNRKTRERTLHYPELVDLRSYCGALSVILDGEVIALGDDGKPSFQKVMRRDGIRRMERVQAARQAVPVTYIIFDILYYNGEWVNKLPLLQRMDMLQTVVKPNESVQLVSSADNGEALFEVMKQQEMEGIVVKKKNSPHLIGEKKDLWLKIKNYRFVNAVIGGVTLSGGVVNAVLLGLFDEEGRLWYVGHSGTGKLSRQDWRNLTERMMPLLAKGRPFVNEPAGLRDALWVRPEVTARIKFAEWTEGGRALRQPSIQELL